MKRCFGSSYSPWPFVMVLFIASVLAFVTWLTLSLAGLGRFEQIAGSSFVFLAVGGTMLHYVIACMRRHRDQGNRG